MDFSFTEEQQDVAALARRILEDKVSHESLTVLEASGTPRFDRSLYAELARANLLGIGLPEAAGGSGLGLLAQSLVLQEIGRVLAPVPYLASIAMAADCLAVWGTPEQIDTWVKPAIDAEVVLTAAIAEPWHRDREHPTTTATSVDGGWKLDGVKTAVPAATIADAVIITASIVGERRDIAAFVVPVSAFGFTITAQDTTDHEPYGYIDLVDVVVGADRKSVV